MKYVISHYKNVHPAIGTMKRIAVADSAEAAVVMAHALAKEIGKNRTKETDGLPDSIHVNARHGGGTAFAVACFLCERDRVEDIHGAIDRARVELKKWKADGKAAKERNAWWEANRPPGKYFSDFVNDEEFKTAYLAHDFVRAGARLAVITGAEARAAA